MTHLPCGVVVAAVVVDGVAVAAAEATTEPYECLGRNEAAGRQRSINQLVQLTATDYSSTHTFLPPPNSDFEYTSLFSLLQFHHRH